MRAKQWRGCAGGLVLAGVLAGCAGGRGKEQEVSTGLSRLGAPDAASQVGGPSPMVDPRPAPGSLADAAARNSALDLLAWQDRKERAATEQRPPKVVDEPAPPLAVVEPNAATEPDAVIGPPVPAGVALDQKIADAAGGLAALLRERAAGDSDHFAAALRLAALEPVSPGAIKALTDGPGASALSPAERQTLGVLGSVMAALGAPGAGGDPGRAADALQAAIDGLGTSLPVRIGAAELCTRVDGFGQYQPVERNVFEAMRPHRVIVYTEVERFGYRPIGEADLGAHRPGPGDKWAVLLTQELELYNESGAMSAWSRPALPIVETSRNKRRDFHIVDQIELPPNLSIGIYHLKITVKDRATGFHDTRTVDLRIVADPALARGGGPDR